MRATVVDLRYRMKDVLKALDRNEQVTILWRGKVKGVIHPVEKKKKTMRMEDHPFFGMCKDDPETVEQKMQRLRRPRYSDLR